MSEETPTEIYDPKTGEVQIAQPNAQDLALQARSAARVLEDVISSNERPPVMFNGKRYLEYPHWQTIASFYHVSVKTGEATYIQIGDVEGFRATSVIIDDRTGEVVGGADSYCMRDEPNWKSKPLFQLASMAQTRAGSKGLSNKYRHIAIIAGYEPTPSEEMTGDETRSKQPQVTMPKQKQSVLVEPEIDFPSSPPIGTGIPPSDGKSKSPTPAQKKLHVIAKGKGLSDEKIKAAMKFMYGKESSKDLTDEECTHLTDMVATGQIRNAS